MAWSPQSHRFHRGSDHNRRRTSRTNGGRAAPATPRTVRRPHPVYDAVHRARSAAPEYARSSVRGHYLCPRGQAFEQRSRVERGLLLLEEETRRDRLVGVPELTGRAPGPVLALDHDRHRLAQGVRYHPLQVGAGTDVAPRCCARTPTCTARGRCGGTCIGSGTRSRAAPSNASCARLTWFEHRDPGYSHWDKVLVAANPSTRQDTIEHIRATESEFARTIAERPTATPQDLAWAATSYDNTVRAAVLAHPHTSDQTLGELCATIDTELAEATRVLAQSGVDPMRSYEQWQVDTHTNLEPRRTHEPCPDCVSRLSRRPRRLARGGACSPRPGRSRWCRGQRPARRRARRSGSSPTRSSWWPA